MDPEQLRQALIRANRLIQQGKATREQIDQDFRAVAGMSFSEAADQVRELGLREQAQSQAQAAQRIADAPEAPRTSDMLLAMAQGASLNLLDDLVGLAASIPGSVDMTTMIRGQGNPEIAADARSRGEEARERFLGRLERLSEAQGGTMLRPAFEGLGALGTAGTTFNLLGRGAKSLLGRLFAQSAGGAGLSGVAAAGGGGDIEDVALASGAGGLLSAVPLLAGQGTSLPARLMSQRLLSEVGSRRVPLWMIPGGLLEAAGNRLAPTAVASGVPLLERRDVSDDVQAVRNAVR